MVDGFHSGWLLVIELGEFTLRSIMPLEDIVWLLIGLLLLTGLSTAVLWWNRRTRPDPFL